MSKQIATVIPTRGMIYASTLLSLAENGITDPIIVSGLPIPDAHNECVRKALENYISHILFVEDDMVIPPGTVDKMLKLGESIVAVEYPLDNGYSTITKEKDDILWCGFGCTLINASIFRKMPQPWFTIDHSYRILDNPFSLEKIDNPNKYGGHDINFFLRCREYGYTITKLENVEAKHLRSKPVRKEENNGLYEITELPPIQFRQEY